MKLEFKIFFAQYSNKAMKRLPWMFNEYTIFQNMILINDSEVSIESQRSDGLIEYFLVDQKDITNWEVIKND